VEGEAGAGSRTWVVEVMEFVAGWFRAVVMVSSRFGGWSDFCRERVYTPGKDAKV
jgi:hypothetical protein